MREHTALKAAFFRLSSQKKTIITFSLHQEGYAFAFVCLSYQSVSHSAGYLRNLLVNYDEFFCTGGMHD